MSTKWTKAQQHCIDARGGTLLVSAAAGSGKTAVLIERITKRILDEKEPLSIENLLIVTFTRAAASEMKNRLASSLQKAIDENPTDTWLRKQFLMLPSAQITTIDSFCTDCLREHASKVNLSPSFSIIEPQQANLLLNDSIDEIMEEEYGNPDHALIDLAEHFLGGDYDDKSLKALFFNLYQFLCSCAFPEEWMQKQIQDVDIKTPLEKTSWYTLFEKQASNMLQDGILALNHAIELCREDEKTKEKYLPNIELYLSQFIHAQEVLSSGEWNDILACLVGLSTAPKIGVIRGDCPIKETIKNIYADVKTMASKYKKFSMYTLEAINNDRKGLYPLLTTLSNIVFAIKTRYQQKKQEMDAVDYGDMESYALELFIHRENGCSYPTAIASQLSEQYEEIYVDEYQDTNETQDEIYMAISREGNNLFFVGDVKQSIYSFRKARPDLFLNRRDSYTTFDEKHYPAAILLDSNFRSRKGVIDITNFVFSQIMTKEASGIAYKDHEELVQAAKYSKKKNLGDFSTELLLVDLEDQKVSDVKYSAEAQVIVKKIQECVNTLSVTEKDGSVRKAEYKDIAILVRNNKGVIMNYMSALKEAGIPTLCNQESDFYSSNEVMLMMSFLRAINNPLQDISLVAIMLSPIGNFTIDDLAVMRLKYGKKKRFYSILHHMRKQEDALGEKIRSFITLMEHYRMLAATLPVHQVLDRAYHETDILILEATKNRGTQRVANLHALYNVACSFEQDGYKGLSAFVRYMDHLEEENDVYELASSVMDDNAVRITTIHKSKGLEYPIVFLADLSHNINFADTRGSFLRHSIGGIGLKTIDPETRIMHRTIMHHCVSEEIRRSNIEEEMRILYVAMTRAREKLYMVTSLPKMEEKLKKYSICYEDTILPSYIVQKTLCFTDWILKTLSRHPQAKEIREYFPDVDYVRTIACDSPLSVSLHKYAMEESKENHVEEKAIQYPSADPEQVKRLQEKLTFKSPYCALGKIPNKITASTYDPENDLISHKFAATSKPKFLQKIFNSAEQGTALHRFMQYSDWSLDGKDYNFEAEIQRLLESGQLNEEQAEIVKDNLRELRFFFASDLFKRMQQSKQYWKELPFSVFVPAKDLYPDSILKELQVPADDVLLQGIVDCAFEEDGKIIIIDYKSNQVPEASKLVDLYKDQLYVYKLALEQIFEMPVSECYLYALHLGEDVLVKF